MIQKIIESGNPILRKKSVAVAKFDKKVAKLVADLKDTLYAQKDPEGVGLAAPQIGKNQRVFLMKYKKIERIVINPKILSIEKSQKQDRKKKTKAKKGKKILEGCLSLPHYYGPLARAEKIKLEYQDESGKKVVEEFSGFYAQIVAHEIDHLNGILFVDHILKQRAPLYKVVGDEWEEVELT